ncbi:type IV secretion system DNA-binding domain-containing protein [Bradyrhizobium sp. CSA207]|uniref:FtsK/SpoIIIE domain-containing protein n=1 Tax=Bradyrhizobium sp. CSA207 TaxID=2698826 RepID=UPI0023AEA16F|nr:FtsK/SpoIIIE domain-containing protein [Bradyrhizobium sp. CSA207]MDE5440425.1 type IV secretion system DNA-binding domain-containing protein [Bradyrhizobium sp. CSA207]
MVSRSFARGFARGAKLAEEYQESEKRRFYEQTPQGAAEKAAREALEAEQRRAAEATAARHRAKMERLERPIPLAQQPGLITFGTSVETGDNCVLLPRRIPHMLVAGTTGSGKSVFLHQLVYQLVRAPEVERAILIDLKGGTEFYAYRDMPNVEIVWDFRDVVRAIDCVMALMTARQDVLRNRGMREWPDGRVFIVIDEYGDIQWEIDNASTKEEKDAARRLSSNLRAISRRARSLGIVLVCALQKPTTDAMDSAVRTNLNLRICFRVSRLLAASVLDDLDALPVNPPDLKTGRFIYYDASRGIRLHLQAQIAPGVTLGDDS